VAKSHRPVSKMLRSCFTGGKGGGIGCRVGFVVGVLDGQSFGGQGGVIRFCGKDVREARAAKVRHVFRLHRERRNKGVAASKKISALDVILEKWVKAQVSAEAGEVVSVHESMDIPVLDVHIPAHEAHLQSKDSGIATII
jgi:hypothetical protein